MESEIAAAPAIYIKQEQFADVVEEYNAKLRTVGEDEGDSLESEMLLVSRSRSSSGLGSRLGSGKGSRRGSTDSGWDTDLEEDIPVNNNSRHDLTGEHIYVKACKTLKITPSNHIIQSFSKPILSVRHRSLGPNEVKSITEALMSNTFVKSLDLEGNNIGDAGASQILRLLLENCFISEVSLSENNIGSRGAEIFSNILKQTRSLMKVNLSGNRFSDKDSAILAEGISANDTVKTLNLSHNEFMLNAGQDLGMAISENHTITELDLSWNHLRMKGAIAIANAMAKNSSIEVLTLRFNGFADDGAAAMGEALIENNTLKILDLSHNRISDKGAVALSKGLSKNITLESLDIGYNPITREGAFALLTAAKEAKELIELLMSEIFLDEAAFNVIETLIQQRSSLKISYQGVTRDKSGKTRNNELDLLRNKIFERIRNYLKVNRLRMVDLFNRWDKDKNLSLTRDEFALGIATANIPLAPEMIDFLVNQLDANKNGTVEYDEFVAISGIE